MAAFLLAESQEHTDPHTCAHVYVCLCLLRNHEGLVIGLCPADCNPNHFPKAQPRNAVTGLMSTLLIPHNSFYSLNILQWGLNFNT